MRLEDIPTLYAADGHARRSRAGSRWPVVSWNRGQFLRATAGTGMAIGLASLGIFPPARKALASHVGSEGYEIKPLPCPSGHGGDTCAVPCSPSTIYPNACYTDPGNHFVGYHRHGCTIAFTRAWRLRQDDCLDVPSDWDGWKWSESSCEGCGTAVFRCHDGYNCPTGINCNNPVQNCDTSVCKWLISCT
jgi:hypothetical protein